MSLVGDGGIYGRDIYGVYGGYTGYMDICVRKDKRLSMHAWEDCKDRDWSSSPTV